MRRGKIGLGLVGLALLFSACPIKWKDGEKVEQLLIPHGLKSITGDKQVTLVWKCMNYEENFAGYNVYVREGVNWNVLKGRIEKAELGDPVNTDGLIKPKEAPPTEISYTVKGLKNGKKYYFVVLAVDKEGNLGLASEIVWDIPRPEGEAEMTNQNIYGANAQGFLFSAEDGRPKEVPIRDAEIFFETIRFEGVRKYHPTICSNKEKGALIVHVGPGESLDDNRGDVAPEEKYYEPNDESVKIQNGHIYVIKTKDGYYGKIWITEMSGEDGKVGDEAVESHNKIQKIKFKWAYQPYEGNDEERRQLILAK